MSMENESTQVYIKDERIVLDWKQDKDFCLKNGISLNRNNEPQLDLTDDCILRNFDHINVENASLENCLFENCDDVTIRDGFVINCVFDNIGYFNFTDLKVKGSSFKNCENSREEDEDSLFCIEDVTIINSCFENINLRSDAYMFEAFGDCDIKKCNFDNVKIGRLDGALYNYEITDGKGIFKISYQGTLIDKASCTGLSADDRTSQEKLVSY